MANDRDPLGVWLGEELRRARLAAGYTSQDQLARALGFDRTVITKAETGGRPPSDDVAAKLTELFPDLCNGLYVPLAEVARRSNGTVAVWHKSSLSGSNGGNCVEVAGHNGMILVRDTKDQGHGPVHRFTPADWRAFVAGVRNGEFDAAESGRLL